MRLETKFNQSHPISSHRYRQFIPKNLYLQKKIICPESIENLTSGGKTPGLAPLAKLFSKYQKGNATYGTGQCDVMVFSKNAIHSSITKHYLQIAEKNYIHIIRGGY